MGELAAAARAALPPGAELVVDRVTVRGCKRLRRDFDRLVVKPSVGRRVTKTAVAALELVDRDGRRKGMAWLRAAVTVRIPRLVAAHDLPAGTALNAKDVRASLMPWTSASAREFSQPDDVEGMVVRRGLAKGDPLARRDLERPLLVRRGAVVRAVVREGGLLDYRP